MAIFLAMNTRFADSVTGYLHRRLGAVGLYADELGFTLVEVMAVVAIAAILIGAAVPPLAELIRSAQLTSATNDMFADMMLARSEAIKRNSRVVLCKSADGTACVTAGGWEQGWIVFHDINNNGVRDGAEEVLSRGHPLSKDLSITGNQNVSRYVSYAPTGTTKLVNGGFQAGTITLCEHLAAAAARQIILSSVGRPRVQKAPAGVCI
jgi:type IV fimbrial biogenesis protein FimT